VEAPVVIVYRPEGVEDVVEEVSRVDEEVRV
jgi:hypothetical protein